MFTKCSVEKCPKNAHSSVWGKRGYCANHYALWRRNGKPELVRAPNGSGCISRGYRFIYVEHNQIPEHRYIVEQFLGRKLKPFPQEVIHHKNGDRLDNRIENLAILDNGSHLQQHLQKFPIINGKRKCTKCKKIKEVKCFSKSHSKLGIRADCKKCQNITNQIRIHRTRSY